MDQPEDPHSQQPANPLGSTTPPIDGTLPFKDGKVTADGKTGREATITPDIDGSKAAQPPTREFGDYELVEELARGGMGVVYKARQAGLNRTVALKMILSGQLAGESEVQRFQAEAEAAAGLDHPGIVPIYEVGQIEGQHFFSMGLVEGQSLSQRITDRPLAAREAAEIVAKVADAVDYAHRQGVIHRDLKPANVLLDKNDEPRVTDFGLAKRIASDSNLTATGQVLGTPNYMPPEQATGRLQDIGPRSDVYALGGVLYAAITGRPPFSADNAVATIKQVIEREPVAPRQLNSAIPRDLETITLKCLQKDPHKRYASAQELADDLRRHLSHKPIQARPVTSVERLVRWSKRQPAIAGLVVTLALSIMIGFAVSLYYAVEANDRAADAERYARQADDNFRQAKTNEATAIENAKKAADNEQRAKEAALAAQQAEARETKRRLEAERQTRIATANHLASQARDLLETKPQLSLLLAIEAMKLRGDEGQPPVLAARQALREALAHVGGKVVARAKGNPLAIELINDDSQILILEFDTQLRDYVFQVSSLDGRDSRRTAFGQPNTFNWRPHIQSGQIAKLKENGDIEIFHLDTKALADSNSTTQSVMKLEHTIQTGHKAEASKSQRVAFSPDGSWIFSVTSEQVLAWNLSASNPLEPAIRAVGPKTEVNAIFPSPDNRWLLLSPPGFDRNLRLYDFSMKSEAKLIELGVNSHSYEFSPNGRWLVTGGAQTTLFDLAAADPTKASRTLDNRKNFAGCAFSPSGRWLAFGTSEPPQLHVWDMRAEPESRFVIETPQRNMEGLQFSPDDRWLAVRSGNDALIWDLGAEKPTSTLQQLIGHEGRVARLLFAHDGNSLFTSGWDGTFRRWDLDRTSPSTAPISIRLPNSYSISADSSKMLTYREGAGLTFWKITPDGPQRIQDDRLQAITKGIQVKEMLVSPDGRWLIAGAADAIYRWDLLAKDPASTRVTFGEAYPHGRRLEVSPDNRWLLSYPAGTLPLQLWRVDASNPAETKIDLDAPSQAITLWSFSKDGRYFSCGSFEGTIRLWNLQAEDIPASRIELTDATNPVLAAALSPDGSWLAAACVQAGFFLWNIENGKAVPVIREPETQSTLPITYSDDSRFICAMHRNKARVWDLAASNIPESYREFSVPDGMIHEARLSPDGRKMVTSEFNRVRLWDLDDEDPSATAIRIHSFQGQNGFESFSPDGRWLITSVQGQPDLHFWPVRHTDLLRLANEVVGRTLSEDERKMYLVPTFTDNISPELE